jgi:hypothetical protein
MDAKQTAKSLISTTKERSAELIKILEDFGCKDVVVSFETFAHGGKTLVPDRPMDRKVYLSVRATLSEDDE